MNSVQWDENAETQNYARNELTTTTQLKNWLKMKESHNKELQMQDQINSDRIINRDQKTNTQTILRLWEIIHKITERSDIIRT